MKWLVQLEGLALLAAGIYGFNLNFDSWGWFAILFLSPDIGMLGYLVNAKLGAITYNLFHHLLIAGIILGVGVFLNFEPLHFYGWIMVSHIGFDRVLGYGLKYSSAFKDTHLDRL